MGMEINMKNKLKVLLLSFLSLLILFVVGGAVVSYVEQPKYSIVQTDGSIEMRQYEPMLIAKVRVDGERQAAISSGFKLLAAYIFGDNTTQNKMKMTSPVKQVAVQADIGVPTQVMQQKIKMTAPVTQKKVDNSWEISFVMPSKYTEATLPKPINSKVDIESIPKKQYAVIIFSGLVSDKNLQKNKDKLLSYLAVNNIKMLSSPLYAFYNPPWTMPFLRKNEVLVEVPYKN
jgi:effector-binding domain-containing protein